MNKPSILVVEDDVPVRCLITTTLKTHGYKYLTASNGETAIMMTTSHNPDIMLLDLGLPDIDGIEVIRSVRTWSNLPIIVLSARSEDSDKIEALDNGADDYLTKPFSVMELISRVKALLRRSMKGLKERVITIGEISLDVERRKVTVAGERCELTYKEYELLKLLMNNAGIVTPREEILSKVWETDFEGESRTIDMHIKTLRQKLGSSANRIKTVRNVGYLFETSPI